MKKLLVLLLALCMLLLPVLTACKDTEEVPEDTEAEEATEADTSGLDEWGRPVVSIDVPESLDFGGEELHIICRNEDYALVDVGDFEEQTNALEQQLYYRNFDIEEYLNIELVYSYYDPTTLNSKLNSTLQKDLEADLKTYDLVLNYGTFGISALVRDYYVNLLDPSAVPYMDLSKPWWNKNYIENAQAYGQLYYITGDYNLSTYNRVMVTYFNESLCLSYGISENLYEVALDGGWTYERLFEYAKMYDDTNGNTVKDANDVYGLLSNANSEAYDGFLYGFQLNFVKTYDDGAHGFDIAGNLKMEDAMSKIQTLYEQDGVWLIAKTEGAEKTSEQQYKMFAESRALFDIDVIYRYKAQNLAFRDMTDSYGILPLPKYDSEQKEYGSGVQVAYTICSIPRYSNYNGDMVSAFLEYANGYNYRTIRPYYFENIVKKQYFSTEDSSKVFDMVLASTDFDFGEIYAQLINQVNNLVWRNVAKNGGTVSRAWAENETVFRKKLIELDNWFYSKAE
ncbi:MAG: hypothetical protein IJZ80_07580 [Clostridia bacterium]|nr:hypothetical protein [Clostridia bacterium]